MGKRKNKKLPFFVIPAIILLLLGAGAFAFREQIKSFIESLKFGNSNIILEGIFKTGDGTVVKGGEMTTIGTTPNIVSVSFKITVKNTMAEIPMEVYIVEATPVELSNAIQTTRMSLSPNGQAIFFTNDILTEPMGYEVKTFRIKVRQDFICPSNKRCQAPDGTTYEPGQSGSLYSEAQVQYDFQPDVLNINAVEVSFVSSEGYGASSQTTVLGTTLITTKTITTTTIPCIASGQPCCTGTQVCCYGSSTPTQQCASYSVHGVCLRYTTVYICSV